MSRAAALAIMILGLTLWGGSARAQAAQPRFSADGLYNIANSYARAGKPGLAVLNYERAALLAPNDPDIDANLELVRRSARLPAEPRGRFERFVLMPSPWPAWIGVLGIVLAGAAAIVSKARPRLRSAAEPPLCSASHALRSASATQFSCGRACTGRWFSSIKHRRTSRPCPWPTRHSPWRKPRPSRYRRAIRTSY
jgi:hypothetical protein